MKAAAISFQKIPLGLDSRIEFAMMCIIIESGTHPDEPMRTNIVIDDDLMDDVLATTGLRTKREAVESGLRLLLRLARQEQLRNLRGKLAWTGDLERMRTDA